ncbi:MAG: hypothetical protein QOC95_1495 [Thermoleophilaceae bacterium]|nr:hypothetical protein [Thermoleophilaceae bacterium]
MQGIAASASRGFNGAVDADVASAPTAPEALHGRRRVVVRVNGRPAADTWAAGSPLEARRLYGEVAARTASELGRHLRTRSSDRAAVAAGLLAGKLPPHPLTPVPRRISDAELTVAVCTNRGAQACDDLLRVIAPALPTLVIENGPADPRLAPLCAARGARHVHLSRPGLSSARNCALARSATPWVLFLDDDCRVGAGGVEALAARIGGAVDGAQDAGTVTGLVLPATLDSPAAARFERTASLARGFLPARHDRDSSLDPYWPARHADWMGVGACMIVRGEAWADVGGFDERLGPGTPARAGDDDAFFAALVDHGWAVLYDPAVCVRHLHRMTEDDLDQQLYGYGYATSVRLLLRAFDGDAPGHDLRTWAASILEDLREWRELRAGNRLPELAGMVAGALAAPRIAASVRSGAGDWA